MKPKKIEQPVEQPSAKLFAFPITRRAGYKRRAVTRLLDDPEWAAWSDREIATRCGVTHPFVSKLRPSGNGFQIDRPRLVERGGKTFEQNTARIGRAPTPAPAGSMTAPALPSAMDFRWHGR